eukprot:630890-Prorocentrum_minimum.AAC.1
MLNKVGTCTPFWPKRALLAAEVDLGAADVAADVASLAAATPLRVSPAPPPTSLRVTAAECGRARALRHR